jgi:hypothetical protein
MRNSAYRPGWIVWLALVLLIPFLAYAAISAASGGDATRCVPASEAQMDFLRYAVAVVQPGNTLGDGYAVKSADYENIWMVAARVHGVGIPTDMPPAIWAVGGDPDAPHTWLSVNGYAHQFSGIRLASNTAAEIRLSSDGVAEAIQCVERDER